MSESADLRIEPVARDQTVILRRDAGALRR